MAVMAVLFNQSALKIIKRELKFCSYLYIEHRSGVNSHLIICIIVE